MATKPRYKITPDAIFVKDKNTPNGKGRVDSVENMLDDIANCCGGVSCCDQALILFDRNTGLKYEIYVYNQVLSLREVSTDTTTELGGFD